MIMIDFASVYGLLMAMFLVLYLSIIFMFTVGLKKCLNTSRTRKKQVDHSAMTEHGCVVSVIIPVRNESLHILRILEEMQQQDFPAHLLEIIVVDDYSEDETIACADSFARQFPGFPLVLVPSDQLAGEMAGKKMAIERAVAQAKGSIMLCTDADTFHHPGWISSMAGFFEQQQTQMVLGPVVLNNGINLLQKVQALEFSGIMGTTAGSANLGYPVMCNGANLAYRRSAFLGIGGYRGNLQFPSGDDQFLLSSVRKQYGKYSVKFNHDPAAIVDTEPEATLAGFLNQRIRWVSKSRGYRDPVVLTVGAVTYLIHFFLLAGFVLGLFFPKILLLALILWLVKITGEFPMVWLMSGFFGKKGLLRYYLIAQVFQLFYVAMAGVAGLFLPYQWKGRKG